ncbi:Sodium/calcium exchanger membrane region [Cordyceps fumosorosea ARSEF 2679]|uniref:Sodium/calcium exchanger membrane region n=1 Tax=Cordyceps fumosorosea (strain ARSEF 2679) TaxID=1081104 RepID=A0A167LHZ9_CORFA|nr:Sodium/calcium exchanger membrane region [Cordyceps fumosorosea ARSEF 2679]OAA53113.1 Sodium/calcium exchanger membrane region [Cordyceps fumosorosea ARSEF 2679]
MPVAEAGALAFNLGAFISTLFLLEFGADKFIAHTSILARRINISEVVVGLLTAGAEWEELAVVVGALSQGRSSLALGNVVGSSISNILGAFSLGLLWYSGDEVAEFDRSARIYSLLLLVLTTAVAPVIYYSTKITWLVGGGVLIAAFVLYFLLVAVAIGRGVLTAPEDSDSDSDSDGDDGEGNGEGDGDEANSVSSRTALLRGNDTPRRRRRHGLGYHGLYLSFGFLAISLAGYVLSQAATNITEELGMSDVLFSVVILAIATTLPEKLIALKSGSQRHAGILVANCAGSNIFLLSLCCGIIMVGTGGTLDSGTVTATELIALWLSTVAFTVTVWFGARYARWIGGAMLASYVVFIVLEFTFIHSV